MGRIFVFLYLIMACSIMALSPLDFKNGDFEGEASAWHIDSPACAIVPDAAHTGAYGLRIQDENPTVESEARSQKMQVAPGKKYAVRFWTRSKVERANTMLHVYYLSENDEILNTTKQKNRYYYRIKGTRQWTENLYISTAPKNAKYASVGIKTGIGNLGRLDIDDIEMLELNKDDAKNMKATTQYKSQNLRFPEIVQERILELEKILPEKPMGVGDQCSKRDVWDKLADTKQGKKAIDTAAKIMQKTFPELTDELYLRFSQNGNRTNYESVNGKRISWIVQLTLGECLENKGRFMPKLEEFLEQFLSQKSWVLPAHDRKLTNFNNEVLYPDLSCSYVASMLAYVDWFLQDKLKQETRQRIRHEVFRRAITPYQNAIQTGKVINGLWWMTSVYNWNAVCTCNLVCASLILMESRHDRAEVLAAMEISNKFFYRGFTSDGYCSEGMGYWSYGFGHYLTMAEIVLASTNGKLNIFNDDPVIPKCCEYARSI
ncbi:MAG: carbohydrate binding domain-containing protein, partial [Victivallales bacterium]|nr:carbohydrate binding domain-containing protein [Victivallales bacterium]